MDTKQTQGTAEALVTFVDGRVLHTAAFGDNKAGDRLYRRAERIAAAVHILTAHVAVHEPLRMSARETCANILVAILDVRDDMRVAHSSRTKEVVLRVRYLVSLVRLLAVAGYISFQNADIMTDALDELVSFLHASQRTAFSDSTRLSKDFFTDVRESAPAQYSREVTKEPVSPKAASVSLVKSLPKQVPEASAPTPVVAEVASARAEHILSILRAQGELPIGKIAEQLPEYSEKMVQRELSLLAVRGLVIKTGEKRWCRYGIAR